MSTRRTVTALFTDLVGSTKLMTSMTTHDAEDVRARHFAIMRGALAVHRGREVKTMGDGFMAVFECAGDALGCAVTMQRTVSRHGTESNQTLGLRIGVSAGDAVTEAGDFFGVPIVEASRLCAVADAGQILVSDIVIGIAGDEDSRRLEPMPPLDLKGLPKLVAASMLGWDDEGDSGLRVALVDDSALLRQGIAKALTSAGIQIVLEAGDTETLHEQLPAANPHVVVLDVRMPPTHTTEGLEAARRIKDEHPGIGVLLLSAEIQPAAAKRLLSGATEGVGYLLKDRIGDIDELLAAIRTVASGGSAIDPTVVAMLTE
ncbi:response regulator [Aeromicrobium sp.]|uniref:response regulator n=1 Tax=Aeromicrobium sp. TaxID=1871063 RepID=UPI003C33B17F